MFNKTLEELIIPMYNGVKVTHEDWSEGEYIQICEGEFITESKTQFIISPWMIHDNNFGILEDLWIV